MDEDFVEIDVRSPADVAMRCIVLAALIRRLWIESSALTDDEDWNAEAFDLREWLRDEGTWNRLTVAEMDFLQRPVGDLSEDQIASVAWQAEGLATLGWALGITDQPPRGDLTDITTVVQMVPAPWEKTAEWIRDARLRPEGEIAAERDRAEILEWRIGIEGPRRVSTGQESSDYVSAIEDVVKEARASALLEADASDFVIDGKPLSFFGDQDLERLSTLAEERLRALNWLCGYGASWDAVPLDI